MSDLARFLALKVGEYVGILSNPPLAHVYKLTDDNEEELTFLRYDPDGTVVTYSTEEAAQAEADRLNAE